MDPNTTRPSDSGSQFRSWLKIGFFVAVPLILLVLPADYFDQGRSICLSVLLFDFECYGCGLTRALMHLIHFEFMEAFYYNPMAFIVFPLLAWLWAKWFLQEARRVNLWQKLGVARA